MSFETPRSVKNSNPNPTFGAERIVSHEGGVDPLVETRELIEGLDFATLQNIFNEFRSRSGIHSDTDFFTLENIDILKEDNSFLRGQYVGDGKMMLNPFEIARGEFEGDVPTSKAEMRRRTLSVLIHELAHATGHNIGSGAIVEGAKKILSHFSKKPIVFSQSGFERSESQKGNISNSFKFFNEGVTDMVGEQAYDEYLRRTGTRAEVSGGKDEGRYAEAYNGSRALVTAFIEMISHSSGVPREKVWEGVISGYMNGIDLDSSELASSLNEVFYPEFIKQLKEAQLDESEVPLPEVIKRMKEMNLSEEAQTKIKIAVEKFAVQLEAIANQSEASRDKLQDYIGGIHPN